MARDREMWVWEKSVPRHCRVMLAGSGVHTAGRVQSLPVVMEKLTDSWAWRAGLSRRRSRRKPDHDVIFGPSDPPIAPVKTALTPCGLLYIWGKNKIMKD